jgi:hypothetical protein
VSVRTAVELIAVESFCIVLQLYYITLQLCGFVRVGNGDEPSHARFRANFRGDSLMHSFWC